MTAPQRLILLASFSLLGLYLIALAFLSVDFDRAVAETGDGPVASATAIKDAVPDLAAAGLDLQPYRNAAMASNGQKVRVDVTDPGGAGVFLRPLGLAGNHIVNLKAASNGHISLRTTVMQDQQYQVPQKEFLVLVTPYTDDVLIYSDDAAFIALEFNSIMDCGLYWIPKCANETFFEERMGIRSPPHDKKSLLHILDWTSNNVVWTDDAALRAEADGRIARQGPAHFFAETFEREALGGGSHTAAAFLSKILNEYGYKAFSVEFGRGPELRHSSVIVKDAFGDGRYYLLDPTFNAVFVDSQTGDWVSLEHILSGPPQMDLLERGLEQRKYLVAQAPARASGCREAVGAPGMLTCLDPDRDFQTYMEESKNAYAAAGISPELSGFTQMIREGLISVGNEAGRDVRNEFLDWLEKANIRLEK